MSLLSVFLFIWSGLVSPKPSQFSFQKASQVAKTAFADSTQQKALPLVLSVKIFTKPLLQDDDEDIIEVPFYLSGNLMMVEAEVNGQKGVFIFDSGAPDLKLNSIHFDNKKAPLQSNNTYGVTGRVQEVRLQSIDSFKWKGKTLENITVESFDLSHIERIRGEKILGLIGFDIFKAYEICLDYKKSILRLYALDNKGDRRAIAKDELPADFVIKFRLEGHLPVIKGKIGKHNLSFGLDTGAEMNLLDIRNQSKVLKHLQILRRNTLNGNGQEKIEVFLARLDQLQVDELVYPNMRIALTNMSGMNQGLAFPIDGMLGGEFFNRYLVSMNFKKKVLSIWNLESLHQIISVESKEN